MATITRFEDIQGWQAARKLTEEVYQLSSLGAFSKDFGLRDQIRRACISIMANIAEGFDCESNQEFRRFLGYARRSVVEVQSLLYAACDLGYITNESFQECFDQAVNTKALIGGFIQYLKGPSKSKLPDT